MPRAKVQQRQRFAVGTQVLVKMPGVVGSVVQVDDKPTVLWEYWHTIRTEHAEQREPGCNLELVPTATTNLPQPTAPRIHIGEMHNSAIIQDSPGASISQTFDISSEEFRNFIHNLRELFNGAHLTDVQRSEADSEFGVIEVEIQSPTPNKGVVRSSLQSLRTILENATGSLIGSAAYAALVHYILHIKP